MTEALNRLPYAGCWEQTIAADLTISIVSDLRRREREDVVVVGADADAEPFEQQPLRHAKCWSDCQM